MLRGCEAIVDCGEGRCAFKSRPPLDPLIDIVLSQCMHCPAMTDIVPVENLCIGAPRTPTLSPTDPHRTLHRPTLNPTEPHKTIQHHTEPHTDRLMDSWWMKGGQHQLSRATEEAATAAHQDGLMQVLCGQVPSGTKLRFVSALFEGISTTINQTL